jgi:CheY-like chemotaxis protein
LIPSDLWEEELTAAVASTGVPRDELVAAMRSDAESAGPPPVPESPESQDSDGRLADSASRLLVSAADALDRSHTGDALANAFGVLVLVAELFDVPRLRQWISRLSVVDDRGQRARGAARIVLTAVESIRAAGDVEALRAFEWEWPEIVIDAPPASEAPARVAGAPPVAAAAPAAGAEPAAVAPAPTLPEVAAPEAAAGAPPEPAAAPPAVAPAPEPAPAAPVSVPRPPAHPRGLIVDRSGIAAGFLARLLIQRGIEVTVTSDPAAAARAQAESAFDFVFLDEELPGGAARKLLAAHPEWRDRAVLIGMDASRPREAELAGVHFVLKPPSDDEITHALASLVARRTPMGPVPKAKGDA